MFSGAFTALVTPFKDGRVDDEALRTHIERQISDGIDGLVPCGTTGESATLTHDEHNRVIDITIATAAGRVPVIAGTGSNSTEETIRLTRHAAEAGADGALLISPYYNKPSQRGVLEHYRSVASATDLPLILYNVPGRTGLNILPETVAELAKIENIVGIKEASGSLAQVSDIIELVSSDFCVLSGDDFTTLPLLAIGGRGAISVASNVLPSEVAAMIKAFFDHDLARANELHYRLQPLNRAMFFETNPVPVKTALAMMGRMEEAFRLPLVTMAAGNRQRLEQILQSFGLL